MKQKSLNLYQPLLIHSIYTYITTVIHFWFDATPIISLRKYHIKVFLRFHHLTNFATSNEATDIHSLLLLYFPQVET